MRHWEFYRGKPRGKNFRKQILSLHGSGLNHPQIAKRLNEKYARYGVNLSNSVICKELAEINKTVWPSQVKGSGFRLSQLLSSAWTKEALKGLAA